MLAKKQKTPLSQIQKIIIARLKLKRREKIIFFKLMGFLFRNNKPFPYSIKSLAINTGYSESSIYESLNLLEKLRLIERIGYTSRVKYQKGSILRRVCTLVQNRIKNVPNNCTLVQKLEKLAPASPETGYQRTSSSLEHKERVLFQTEYHEYVKRIENDFKLGLIKQIDYLDFEEWKNIYH